MNEEETKINKNDYITFYVSNSEKALSTHSSTLAWRIPWPEEPGRLQSMGLLKVGHHWATSLSLFTFMYWRRKWRPTPVFLPGEFQGQGNLVAAWVAQSWIWLKRLSSSNSVYQITNLQHLTLAFNFILK